MIQHACLGHLNHPGALLQFVFVRRRASYGVLREISVNNFNFFTSSLKLQGRLLLFLVQSISMIKGIKSCNLWFYHARAAIGGAN